MSRHKHVLVAQRPWHSSARALDENLNLFRKLLFVVESGMNLAHIQLNVFVKENIMKRVTALRMILLVALSIVFLGYFTEAAEASPISYNFSSTAAFGNVNLNDFNNASFLISIAGDTTNVGPDPINPLGFAISGLNGNITLTGTDAGTGLPITYIGTFLDTLNVFVGPDPFGNTIVGFGDDALGLDLLDLSFPVGTVPGLDTYDLTSGFGPITAGIDPDTAVFAFEQFGGIPMDFGLSGPPLFDTLSFDTIDNATFQAVPEPSTMLLLASALVGLVGFRKKLKIYKAV